LSDRLPIVIIHPADRQYAFGLAQGFFYQGFALLQAIMAILRHLENSTFQNLSGVIFADPKYPSG
jgi:hypothetical protein